MQPKEALFGKEGLLGKYAIVWLKSRGLGKEALFEVKRELFGECVLFGKEGLFGKERLFGKEALFGVWYRGVV